MSHPALQRAILLLPVFWVSPAALAADSVPVRGYFRSNGTYVAPYTRSAPRALP